MSSSRFKPELYRVLIHPAMSISIASSGVLAAIWLVVVNFGIVAPPAGLVVAVVAATVLEAVAGNIMYKERAGIGNRIRELLIYVTFLYATFSIGRTGRFTARFFPSFDQALPLLAVAAAWLIAFAFHNRLRGREALLRSFHGRHGSELRRAVLERQHDMALTVGQLRKARKLIGTLLAILCVLAVFGAIDPIGASVLRAGSGAFAVLVIYSISAIVVVGSLNTFIDEYAANGEGIAVPLRFQRRRSIAAAAVIGIVLVVAFALSRNRSVLPIEAIADFFRWLGSLFDREVEDTVIPPRFEPEQQGGLPPELRELLEDTEGRETPLWIRILVRLLERLAIWGVVGGAVLLVFGPLFSRGFRRALARIRAGQFLRELWNNLKRRFRILSRFLKYGLGRRGRTADDDEAAGIATGEAWREHQWKPGLRKRRQMDRVVQVFVEVARWGERHGVTYSRSEAAKEYLRRISAIRPELYPETMAVGDTFCEAKFSRHLLPREQMRAYVHSARSITKSD